MDDQNSIEDGGNQFVKQGEDVRVALWENMEGESEDGEVQLENKNEKVHSEGAKQFEGVQDFMWVNKNLDNGCQIRKRDKKQENTDGGKQIVCS